MSEPTNLPEVGEAVRVVMDAAFGVLDPEELSELEDMLRQVANAHPSDTDEEDGRG